MARSLPLAAITRASLALALADRVGGRLGVGAAIRASGRELVGGVAGTLLHETERNALGEALYDAARGRARRHVPAWEAAWLASSLPPPPARVLIGGAGTGREAAYLEREGYAVSALEPATLSAAACARALRPGALVARATYEMLSSAVLESALNGASELAGERFDAVLLGWTSLMHVVERRERARLFLALDLLCPEGPILLSFHPGARAAARGRAHAAGRAIGALLARARSARVVPADDDERFGVVCGFLQGLERGEIEAHAHAVGRGARWDGEDEGCLRATLALT